MSENSASRKMLSLVLLAAGAAGMVIALILDFSGSGNTMRGPLLIIGAIAFLVGLYLFPTVEHHRSIINFIFLFPLLFTFAVTVIIPLLLGIFYSFTDWNGIKVCIQQRICPDYNGGQRTPELHSGKYKNRVYGDHRGLCMAVRRIYHADLRDGIDYRAEGCTGSISD